MPHFGRKLLMLKWNPLCLITDGFL